MTEKLSKNVQIPAAEKALTIADWLDAHKARDIVVLDVSDKNTLTDVVILASASSVRHGQSLADGIVDLCRDKSFSYLHVEGKTYGQWILIDLNDVIVHVFQDPVRLLYNLEGLWRDVKVLRDGRKSTALS